MSVCLCYCSLPYFEATLMETLRLSTVIPLGVWHNTTEDLEFHGFFIPADTMIIPLQYGVHHDLNLWVDPEKFNPDRFLDRSGPTPKVIKPEAFIPFSVGKRVCIGENLAKDELFLIITAILQNFTIRTDPGSGEPTIVPTPGPISSPQPHKIVFEMR